MEAVSNELHAVMLNLTDIVQSDAKAREVNVNAKEFSGLVKSVSVRGVLQPVTVRQIIDPENQKVIPGKYELIDGGHRLEAAKLAGLTQIPALIYTDVSDDELVARQTILNICRIPQKPSETLHQIKLYTQRHQDLTQAEVGAWFDMSEVKLGQMLKLSNLTAEASKLVDAGDITLSNAFQLVRLAPEDQIEDILIDAANMTIDDFSATVKRLRSDRTSERRGLPKKEGFDPKLLKKKEIEDYWQEVVYAFEQSAPDNEDYTFVSAQKLALDRIFQVDAESTKRRQEEKDAKKVVKTLADQENQIVKKKAELDQLNADLEAAKTKEEVVGV